MLFRSIRKWFKDFFTLNGNEQKGILALLILIVILLIFNIWVIPIIPLQKHNNDPEFDKEVIRFLKAQQQQMDSIALLNIQDKGKLQRSDALKKLTPFPFDPNKINQETGQQLGLSLKQITTIQHYLNKGGQFRKPEDFKKMYCISTAEYDILEPFIRIQSTEKQKPVSYTDIHLNTCSQQELVQQLHLYPNLAHRIIKYRNLLGNYYSKTQLREVYGLSKSVFNKIKSHILCDSLRIERKDLNTAPFKTLLHHPYLNYKTTLQIVRTREKLHDYKSWTQLKDVAHIPDSVSSKIHHYFYIRPSN